jgi:chaperone modulatory protein CbpM
MTSSETRTTTLVGTILEEEVVLSLAELCRASRLPAERVIELANEGIVDPIGRGPRARFAGRARARADAA